MKKLFIIVIFCIFCFSSFASIRKANNPSCGIDEIFLKTTAYQGEVATVSGKVTDRNGTPLAGVMVRAFNAELGKHYTAVSDKKGQFTFWRMGIDPNTHVSYYSFVASSSGYQDSGINSFPVKISTDHLPSIIILRQR